MKGTRIGSLLLALLAMATALPARAQQSVADFYAGKQLRFIIRSATGGGYDLYARLLGTNLVRHIPGNPTIIFQNMPGGGGIQAANYMGEIAPRDGTYLSMIGQSLPLEQALGTTPSLKINVGGFGWIGNITNSNLLLYTWHNSPVRTMQDAMTREATMGGSGAGSISSWLTLLCNNVLGTKFKIVNGYQSASEIKLAMERGEIDGYGGSAWAAVLSSSPELVRNHLITILVQLGLHKEKDLPDVPLLDDLAGTPQQRAILAFVAKSMSVGRPLGTTPGVPAERLAALRKAFDDTLVDAEFLAEAARAGAEISPMNGAALQNIVEDVMNAPPDLKSAVRAALPDGF